jgi:hypothetical protein
MKRSPRRGAGGFTTAKVTYAATFAVLMTVFAV